MPKKYLGKEIDVIIDRPVGASHPQFKDCIYPINYGFVPNTTAGDGAEIDVYVLRQTHPLTSLKAKVVAVIKRENDVEFKLVAAPVGNSQNVTVEEVERATSFMERYFKSSIIM